MENAGKSCDPQESSTLKHALTFLWHDVYLNNDLESGFTDSGAARYKLEVEQFKNQIISLVRARADSPVLLPGMGTRSGRGTPFAITVDDGGVSYYTVIAPCLEAVGWRGHCMVTTGYIDKPGFLNKSQIRELHDMGHVIGSHSVTHPARFSSCSEKQMFREWSESRKVLEDIIGQPVISGSIPGGYYSPTVARIASQSGLKLLFTSEPQTGIHQINDCAVVGRYTVRRGHTADYVDRLAVLDPSLRAREWFVWNSKKLLKNIFGTAYPQISSWTGRIVS